MYPMLPKYIIQIPSHILYTRNLKDHPWIGCLFYPFSDVTLMVVSVCSLHNATQLWGRAQIFRGGGCLYFNGKIHWVLGLLLVKFNVKDCLNQAL